MLTAAEQLSHFVPLVGGTSFAPCLLSVLQKMAGIEETVVREQVRGTCCCGGCSWRDLRGVQWPTRRARTLRPPAPS